MDVTKVAETGSRERYPLLLLLMDKESGESGEDLSAAGATGGAREKGYGVGGGGGAGGGGVGVGGYERFGDERGGHRLARGAATLIASWPRHVALALTAALAVGGLLLIVALIMTWAGGAPAAETRDRRYCSLGGCVKVSLMSLDDLGPRLCFHSEDEPPIVVSDASDVTDAFVAPAAASNASNASNASKASNVSAAVKNTSARTVLNVTEAPKKANQSPRSITQKQGSDRKLPSGPFVDFDDGEWLMDQEVPRASSPSPQQGGASEEAPTPWLPPVRPTQKRLYQPAMFFVTADGDAVTRQQACAVESAARFNKRAPVSLLVLTTHAGGDVHNWPSDAKPVGAAALRAVLQAYDNFQVVAINGSFFERTPLRELWMAVQENATKSAGEAVFPPALRLGARMVALWEYGGAALDMRLLSLHNGTVRAGLRRRTVGSDAVRVDTKEGLVLSVTERCHAFVIEMLRSLAEEAQTACPKDTQAKLLSRSVARALPDFCKGGKDGAPALEERDDGALSVRVQCAAGPAPMPESLLCRSRMNAECAWASVHAAATAFHMAELCPVAAGFRL